MPDLDIILPMSFMIQNTMDENLVKIELLSTYCEFSTITHFEKYI